MAEEVSARSPPVLCLPTLFPTSAHVFFSGGRRLGAVTSGTPIAYVPGEFGGDGGAVVLALGSLPALSSFRHRHLDSEARQLYWRDGEGQGTHAFLGVGLACKRIKG